MDTSPREEQEDSESLSVQASVEEWIRMEEARNQLAKDYCAITFTWRIGISFSRIEANRLLSEIFAYADSQWRILIFLRGEKVDHLSLYLKVADPAILPIGWSRHIRFSFVVVNQFDRKHSLRKDSTKQFTAETIDWGFISFMPLYELYNPDRGYLHNDTIVVEAQVGVEEGIGNTLHVSKQETGYIGLKNQGATCYMNSLLQTLYHIPYFRKVVFRMPVTLYDKPSTSITMALQRLFYKLQHGHKSVSTKKLTKSFGWDPNEAFLQRDVQEFNRVLCGKLEEKMEKTVVEGGIQQLFEGHHMSIIDCINVEHRSGRIESFYDLQLDVKGCRDVYDSFNKYVAVEHLEGDNKYHAAHHGFQDAEKRVLFNDFPPVLQLHLKRFEYDFVQNIMVKINDCYKFPLQLDLDIDNGKYLSPKANRSIRNLYTLHSVLVHTGDVHHGHYYAFIRPALSSQWWYKFDDEHVTKEDIKKSLDELYGGEEETIPGIINFPFNLTRNSNAYMLVYVRESDMDKVMCSIDEKDIPEHLRKRSKREQDKKEQQEEEKEDAHLYAIVKVSRNQDFFEHIGGHVFFDLVDHNKVEGFPVLKSASFSVLKEKVAQKFGVPVQLQRFWHWAKRENGTYRLARPLTPLEETKTTEQLMEVSREVKTAQLNLFLEVELGLDEKPIPLPDRTEDDILLFFKFYDPEITDIRYAGKLYVKGIGTPADILTELKEMVGLAPDEEITLYKEIMFEPTVRCEFINMKFTFKASQLVNGDIVCFQKSLSEESTQLIDYPDVPTYLEHLCNFQVLSKGQVIHFRSLEKPKDKEFDLELSRVDTYDEVVKRVAHRLGVDDPSRIRLTSQDFWTHQPNPCPLEYRGVDKLLEMLVYHNHISDVLYYEILDMPMSGLHYIRTLEIAFFHAENNDMDLHFLGLPEESTVGDLLHDLRTMVELSHPNAEIRLMEVFMHKIYKIFAANESIKSLNDKDRTLRAEEICEEERSLGPLDCMIHVYHFEAMEIEKQMQIQNFGVPFLLVIHKNEVLSHVKIRVQKKLNVPDDEFSKWKFAVVSEGRAEYLQDSDILFSCFQNTDSSIYCERYFGLEHLSQVKNQDHDRPSSEKPVKM